MSEHEKRLLNVLYSHLAYIWQADIVLCSSIVFVDKILNIESYQLSLALTHVKNIQVNHMSIHYPLIGIFRIIFHFNSDLYLDLSDTVSLGYLTLFYLISVK